MRDKTQGERWARWAKGNTGAAEGVASGAKRTADPRRVTKHGSEARWAARWAPRWARGVSGRAG